MCLNKHLGRRNGSFSQLLLWISEKEILEARYVPHHQLVIKTRHTVEQWHDGQFVAGRRWVGGQGKRSGSISGRLTEKKCYRYWRWLVEGISFVWGKKISDMIRALWSLFSISWEYPQFLLHLNSKGAQAQGMQYTCTKVSVWLNKNGPILIWYYHWPFYQIYLWPV